MNYLSAHDLICQKSVERELADDEAIHDVPGLPNPRMNHGTEAFLLDHRDQYGFPNFSN